MSSPEPQPTATPPGSLRTVLIVVGSILLATVLVFTALWFFARAATKDTSGTYSIAGSVESVIISADVAEVKVRYDDVASAEIQFAQDGSAREMSYEESGTELRVTVVHPPRFGQWFGEWLMRGGTPRLTVVLPHRPTDSPPNLTITNSVGSVEAAGEFGIVDVRTDVGELTVRGDALRANLRAETGGIRVEDYAVEGALVAATAVGDIHITLATAPETLEARSDVGSVEAYLAHGDYRIDAETSVGTVRQDAASLPDAARLYRFSTSVGDITVSPR